MDLFGYVVSNTVVVKCHITHNKRKKQIKINMDVVILVKTHKIRVQLKLLVYFLSF